MPKITTWIVVLGYTGLMKASRPALPLPRNGICQVLVLLQHCASLFRPLNDMSLLTLCVSQPRSQISALSKHLAVKFLMVAKSSGLATQMETRKVMPQVTIPTGFSDPSRPMTSKSIPTLQHHNLITPVSATKRRGQAVIPAFSIAALIAALSAYMYGFTNLQRTGDTSCEVSLVRLAFSGQITPRHVVYTVFRDIKVVQDRS